MLNIEKHQILLKHVYVIIHIKVKDKHQHQ